LVFFKQAESMTLSNDTAVSAGNDALMSGAGNNYATTTFATVATTAPRTRWDLTTLTAAQRRALNGTYRVFVCVRRSDATSVIKANTTVLQAAVVTVTGSLVTVPKSTSRQLVDLGLITIGQPAYAPGRYSSQPPTSTNSVFIDIYAQRDSGGGSIDWDFVLLMPADQQFITWFGAGTNSVDLLLDGVNERMLINDTSGAGTANFDGTTGMFDPAASISGGFPVVLPNQTNRFLLAVGSGVNPTTHAKATTTTATVSYWPRYLYVRPATT
jgi:hypothetical protein